MTARIVGIDLSLTSTGLAVITATGDVELHRIRSTGKAGASLPERNARLGRITGEIADHLDGAALVVIEGPSFGQARQGGQHDRAGLWWLTVDHVHGAGIPVAEVPPSVLKKYITGKGNASKDEMLAAVIRRYPGVMVSANDEADALALVALGARHLNEPIDTMPAVNCQALAKVRWPEGITQ